jgi:hypothetical protein
MLFDEPPRLLDDMERVGLCLVAGGAPGRDAVAAQNDTDRARVFRLYRGDVQAELEAGPAPRHPDDGVAEDFLGQPLSVCRCGERYRAVGVQMVDVRHRDEPVHCGVDGWRGRSAPVEAEVQGGDHLVLTVLAGVDVDQAAQPVEAQDSQSLAPQRAQIASGTLDPEQLDVVSGRGVEAEPFG